MSNLGCKNGKQKGIRYFSSKCVYMIALLIEKPAAQPESFHGEGVDSQKFLMGRDPEDKILKNQEKLSFLGKIFQSRGRFRSARLLPLPCSSATTERE